MQNSFHRLMQEYDLILCPVQATTALPHGEAHNHHDKFAFVRYFNLINNPVGTVNIGFDQQGLPFGMQLPAPLILIGAPLLAVASLAKDRWLLRRRVARAEANLLTLLREGDSALRSTD